MEENFLRSQKDYLSQMEHGALLNPRIDSTFKALFTQPTPESEAALHSFLEAAIEMKIKSYELTQNDAPILFLGQRGVSYDINCELEDGRIAEIEMQSFNQEYDYGKRAEYQVSRLETTYLAKGDDWENAPIVYQITVLNFNYTPKGKNAINRFAMRTKDGVELSNSLNVIFIELPKVTSLEQTLESNSMLENWALFLKDADNPTKQTLIHNLAEKEDGIMNAQQSLSNISANRDLWIAQYRQELAERDYRSGLNAARIAGLEQGLKKGLEKGMAQGLEKGMAQGLEKGMREKALETAKNALGMGLSVQQAAKISGLDEAELSNLI